MRSDRETQDGESDGGSGARHRDLLLLPGPGPAQSPGPGCDQVLLLPPVLPAEHEGGVEETAGAAGAGLQPEGALVEGGTRSDGGGAFYGAGIKAESDTG